MQTVSSATRARRRPHATLLLPGPLAAAIGDEDDRRFLARGRVQPADHVPASDLDRLLAVLGRPPVRDGQAALRWRGQTGSAPSGWVAGADPVWLQAGLDKLYLHAPPAGEVDAPALARLLADLEARLFGEGGPSFRAVGESGYLCGATGMATSALPAAAVSGQRPDDWLPAGREARDYLALTGEIQLALHEHPLNAEREAAGRQPLNGLWLWGGGTPPVVAPVALPPLHADNDLVRGYWLAAGQRADGWPGTLADCLAAAAGDVVACPTASPLAELRALLRSGELGSATLVAQDGARVELARGLRVFLRRRSAWVMNLETV